MIGVVVAMHGALADALVAAATEVLKTPGVPMIAVGVIAGDDATAYERRLHHAVQQVRGESDGVLILTDMFGGTPSNVSLTLHRSGEVEVLTGANLPMLIKALQLAGAEEVDLMTAARHVRDAGARAISVASDVLYGDNSNPPRETPG